MNKYQVNIPEGKSGFWKVKKFIVTEEQAKIDMMRGAFHGGRYTPAGTYTKLTRNNQVIMSDTPDEISDHYEIINNAKGIVLINGLGLGMVLKAVLENPEVKFVYVIEKSIDVINLVAPSFDKYKDKLQIIQCDAFEYKPPKGIKYDCVWHDIWDNICIDNLPEMTKLHRKYGKLTKWQNSWYKGHLEYLKRHERWR